MRGRDAPARAPPGRRGEAGDIPDLVERDFTAGAQAGRGRLRARPGSGSARGVGHRRLRAIVGWAMDDSYKTLITDAIRMAAEPHPARQPSSTPTGEQLHLRRIRSRAPMNSESDNQSDEPDLLTMHPVDQQGVEVELVNREQFPTREIAGRLRTTFRYTDNRRGFIPGLGYNLPAKRSSSANKPRKY